ncbi:Ankyrin repeat domain-containing protein 6 [Zootermopsis nevadensis]|uniref:Ankyrin repeat domain-containing protein 6 n=2 Tax=Zootermopsis nevadensis TaxID=136037 RepID=A0A067R473_ZOONE|nr:Ankyrin repeat domain-containing protein 6 [Zootermopsis nevadensis]
MGCTALQRAAAEGHLEVVKQLIKNGADVNRQDNVHGNTALHEASWKGYSHSVAALGKAKANLHLKNCGGFAALHLCCQNGHNQSCRELLLAGCNPDLQNNYGDTPLHTSARYGHAGVTRILISAQCRVSDQNKNGDTALHIAAAMGRRKLTRILLEAGCDKSLKNKQNETAREIATRKDLNEILVILNSPSATRSKSKSGKTGHEKDHNEKKRGKNESGTSSKDSSSRQKDKKKHKNAHKVHFERPTGKQWSPYGCHYYPDPKAFPQPNLDSLPHEPLKKGEQYYLDLAGNICKGPVGVGYTCYCAPFFRHMEARLDRDKQELKEHIDQAHQRLDQKVSSLERRTQGQISELTRCVVAERALCDQRHLHLAQWITRGAAGRGSERVRGSEPPDSMGPVPVPRARSLEHMLDHQTEWREQQQDTATNPNATRVNKGLRHDQDHRSLEMLADDGGNAGWRRRYMNSSHEISCRQKNAQAYQSENKHETSTPNIQPNHTYAHELAFRLKQGIQKSHKLPKSKQEHNKSFETLLDKDVTSWRGQLHRRSAHELPASRTNNESTNNPESFNARDKHNRSFDTLLDHRSISWRDQPHYRSVNELPASQHQRPRESINGQGLCQSQDHNRSFDVLLENGITSLRDQSKKRSAEVPKARKEDGTTSSHTSTWKEKYQQESKEDEQRHKDTQADNASPDWREEPLRRSVHEMVARFQSAQQASQIVPAWKIHNKLKSADAETPKFPEVKHGEPPELPRFDGRREHEWQSQNFHRGNAAWQGEAVAVHGSNHYRCHDDNGSSESSDAEDGDEDGILRIPEAGNPDYENVVATCPWQVEESRLMSGLPYRSRSAVYSPTHEQADLHNDSGYSTKLYGSSKGPSPSLSGQLECEGILPTQNMFTSNKLPNMCEQTQPNNTAPSRNRYHERGDGASGTSIVAASLV